MNDAALVNEDVLFEIEGRAGIITLNRPKALNALTHPMCIAIHDQMKAWEDNPAVQIVLIRGAGDRAFCAGGDVVSMHRAGRAGGEGYERFFFDEYRADYLTSTFPKPYVALIDGIVMGGGVGLSVHGPYRVATEKTLFAMPETGIGLIPDVGGTHLLGHMPGQLGVYLGLLGERLKAADCLYAGIATHYVPSERIEALAQALIHEDASVEEILSRFHADPGESALAGMQAKIDRYFAGETVEEIVAALSGGDDWAVALRDRLLALSPTSLKLTLRAVRAGRGLDLAGCLRQEYRMVCRIKHGQDFYEGVRAQLIDKDRNPRWSPASLADVTPEMVEAHFQEPAGGDVRLD
ncbi:enoyl-CoA hydratase/isomerase family protein [Pedomonas mirosovicensis]|uniref:enoyl-CoA hydratase/isomerase family protein n=1 Tax=Pedomonas mirosovicensis TaxID=2908641 RepID=UPI002169B974|nr:enoyl-CoA hydratase/isomerase family protein [Pedomonas mirosovicensis]MCH8685465.1 enoyl-CoA hydratase/isomerase family protein [Pedomonas mirosovicensis]